MNETNKIRIGILTSGGDAPGMNNVINGVFKTLRSMSFENSKADSIDKRTFELVLIKNGYKGLFESDFQIINAQ